MTHEPTNEEQRKDLRQQLQTHRRILISMLNPAPAVEAETFPRSMIMRMFTGKSTILMLFLAEALPMLVARYIARSSFRADHK